MNTTKPTLSPIVTTDHPQHHMTWTPTEIKWITAYAERAVDEAVTTLHNKWLMAQVTASAGVSKEHIQQPQGLAHRPMETAPRDGTIVRLLVQFEDCPLEDDNTRPLWTIGGNSFENTGEDLWQFAGWCWTQDKFTDGVGTPVGWLPLVYEADVQQPTVPVVSDEQIIRDAVSAMPNTNPLVADDLIGGHTMHTEAEDIVAIWKAGVQWQALHAATQPCGHPASLVVRSAESGEPLYCEACDDKSGRRDAEMREAELLEANQKLRDEILALRPAVEPMTLPPVEGDVLPAIGSKVLIHLASSDSWAEHEVVGYYVWEAINELAKPRHHRVFVRVRDSDGILNARHICDLRGITAKPTKEAEKP